MQSAFCIEPNFSLFFRTATKRPASSGKQGTKQGIAKPAVRSQGIGFQVYCCTSHIHQRGGQGHGPIRVPISARSSKWPICHTAVYDAYTATYSAQPERRPTRNRVKAQEAGGRGLLPQGRWTVFHPNSRPNSWRWHFLCGWHGRCHCSCQRLQGTCRELKSQDKMIYEDVIRRSLLLLYF